MWPQRDEMESNAPSVQIESSQPQLTVIAVPFRLRNFDLEVGHRANTRFGTTLITGHPGFDESLDETARRIVHQWIGCDAQYIEQLYTLSTERRDKREAAVSFVALFRQEACLGPADDRMHWSAVDGLEIHDDIHRMVFDYALLRLKAKFGYTNIAFHLLPESFTLSELQQTYEHVLGHQVDKRNFRRRMTASGTLIKTNQMRRDGSHRPPALYQFATQDDHAAYLTPSWAAASFSHRRAVQTESSSHDR
jgi:8-oxo-dGTP diphosphatase